MKKIIFFLFVNAFMQTAFAQNADYKPFIEEGKVWNMYYHNDLAHEIDPTYYYRYFIQGDTIIAGQNCKKFYAFNEDNDNKTEYKMAFHESEGKVYFIPIGSTESHILYDFSIPKGTSVVLSDPIHPELDIEMQNNKDGIAKINGVNRHCFFVKRADSAFEDYPSGWWVEGIGSELGPLNTWGFGAGGNYRFFWSCEMNGEFIFNKSNLMEAGKDEYYPDGTRWTEIRLDTLKYDGWYSKVDGEWLPNFETIEYYVKGEYLERYDDAPLKCVYTNGPTWTDSLTLLVRERMYDNTVEANIPVFYEDDWGSLLEFPSSTAIYQFDWSVGKKLYFQDLLGSSSTCLPPCGMYYFGIIEDIKEGYFGGVRSLKYVDLSGEVPVDPERPWYTNTNGGRIIQGIGITEWNDGECLFGPVNPYFAMTGSYGNRHYRSMLVHFERDGEVLYDVWPEKGTDIKEYVTYTEGQMATIILPTTPDASKGKYYRLDRVEDERIVFEQELHPLAHVPYIIVPNEDFSIDLSTLDLAGCYRDTVSVDGISFIGSFVSEAFDYQEGFYIDFIDTTPDCRYDESCVIGALRAYLLVRWDDPYNQGGTKVPPLEKLEILLYDVGTGIDNVDVNENGDIYDLQGRKLDKKTQPGIYIKNGKKVAK